MVFQNYSLWPHMTVEKNVGYPLRPRAVAPKPKIMLLDEPLSNLDALLRVELRAHLRAIHREVGFTGIYVTHDQIEAFNLGTRVAVMKAGKIEQLGSAREVYDRPATEYVAKFLGIRN